MQIKAKKEKKKQIVKKEKKHRRLKDTNKEKLILS